MRAAPDQKHLVALDLDGTVVHRGEIIDDEVGDAIRAVHEAGHEVVIATGRSIETTLSIVEQLRIRPEWVVCCNGAVTLKRDPLAERAYRREYVEAFDATEVLTRIHSHLITEFYALETDEGELLSTQEMPFHTLPSRRRVVEFDEMLGRQAIRLLVKSPDHAVANFLSVVDQLGLTRTTYGVGEIVWLDIAPVGVSKESALETVRGRVGVDRSRVFAIGDGDNDIEMLRWADRHGDAVAMGHAPDHVKAVAGRITGTLDERGVAAALRYRFPVELGFEGAEPGDLV